MVTATYKRLPASVRRRHILDAAREVFLRHGLAGTRTRQIAEEAGVDERLLYHYFTSKEAIYEAAVLEPLQGMMDELLGMWERAVADGPGSDDAKVLEGYTALLRTMAEVVPSLGMILYSDEDAARAFYRDHFYPLVQRGHEAASAFAARATGHGFDETVMHALLGMCINVVTDAWLRQVPLDVDAAAGTLSRLTMLGLRGMQPESAAVRPERRIPRGRRS